VRKGDRKEAGVGMPLYSKGSEVAGLLDVGVRWGTSLTSRSPLIRPRSVPVYFGCQMYKSAEAQLLESEQNPGKIIFLGICGGVHATT
jgi:hypothetical protein